MRRTSKTIVALRRIFARGMETLLALVGVFGLFSVPEDGHPHFAAALLASKAVGLAAFYVLYLIDKAAFPQNWAADKPDEV